MEKRLGFLVGRTAGIQNRTPTGTGILRRFHHGFRESGIHNTKDDFVIESAHFSFLRTASRLSLKKLKMDLPIMLAIGIV